MIIIPPTPSHASPAAQELGQKIATVIREYQQSHPGLPSADIHQALRIARMNSGAGPNPRFLIALLAGLLLLGGFLTFYLSSKPDGDSTGLPIMPVLVAVFAIVMLGIIVVAKR